MVRRSVVAACRNFCAYPILSQASDMAGHTVIPTQTSPPREHRHGQRERKASAIPGETALLEHNMGVVREPAGRHRA